MGVQVILQIGFLVAFVGALLFAAAVDVASYTIPNWLVIAIAAGFLPTALLSSGHVDWLDHLGAGALVFVIGAGLFRIGVFGGGDVKLWAAVALWAGFGSLWYQATWIALLGGAFGMIVLGARAATSRCVTVRGISEDTVPVILRPKAAIPYGVAIAAGAILSLPRIAELTALRGFLK